MDLLSKLDNFISSKYKKIKIQKNKLCCDNPQIYNDNISLTCHNCGRINPHYEEILPSSALNPKFQAKTYVPYNSKYRHLSRLNKWDSDYKETTANKSYLDIREICDNYNLGPRIKDRACFVYKYIYIDNNITSRNKIKQSLYIICIKKAATFNNIKLNLNTLLNDYELTMKNYNKAYSKIKKLKELNF